MKIKIIGPDDPALAAARKNIAENPHLNLELKVFPWAEYRAVLMDTLQAPSSPNQAVFIPGHVWIPELAEAGFITGLDELIAELPEDAWTNYHWDDIFSSVQQESCFQDQQYMIPFFNDAHILFYREDLVQLDAPGQLPEVSPLDLVSLAKKTHRPPHIYGIALKAHPSEILFDWLPYLLAAGGRIADANLRPAFVSEEGFRALQAYCQLREFAPPLTHTYGNEEIAEVLRKGQAALVTTWGGQAAPIFLDEHNPFRDKYLAAVFPQPCGGTWGITLPSNQSRNDHLKILEVLLELNSPQQDLDVLLAAGSPVRQSSYTDQAYHKYSWLRAQREIYNRIALLPIDPRVSVYLGPLTEGLVNAFLGNQSPEEALQEAESRIGEALAN
jgi:multiple sugar transport system substrate-binding protein